MTNAAINTNVRTLPANETAFDFSNTKLIAETILENTREIGGIRIGSLPLELLFVDTSYQRPAYSKVQKIAKEFDVNKCGFILVSYRPEVGKFAIIDGGHRFEAAQLVGLQAITCQILTGLTVEQEALIFAAQNENCVRLTENDLLKAQVCAKDAEAIGFQNLCKEFGIRLYRNQYTDRTALPTLVCIKTARGYYATNPDALRWAFTMICKAKWNTVRKGFSSYTLTPLWNLYQNRKGNVSAIEETLLGLMRPLTPQILLTKSKSVFPTHTGTEAITALLECYLEGGLPALLAAEK